MEDIYDIAAPENTVSDDYKKVLQLVKWHYGCTTGEAIRIIENMPRLHRCFVCKEIIPRPVYREYGLICSECDGERRWQPKHVSDKAYLTDWRYHGNHYGSGEW